MNTGPKPDYEDLVAGFVATALEQLDRGEPVDLEALCGAHGDCVPTVAAALGLRHGLAAMHEQRSAPDATGRVLAERYRLLAPIGSGAAGAVFRARDERLQRDVAVKLLHRDTFGGGDAEARFRREAVVLAAHEHRHIVRIHDQGRTAEGTTFLVTELLRGQSLQEVLAAQQARMPHGPDLQAFADCVWLRELLPAAQLETNWLRQAVRWVAELGEGLIAAHADGVCHRDVKPSNAFVRDDGSAVLLDFGIAVRLGDASITRAHAVLGTPCYMAPEQAAGQHEPHPALDIYSLTATLYHLLTLQPPHQGDLQQVLFALRHDAPMPAARLVRGLPRDLVAILDRGLERQPAHRYRDMATLVHDLRAFLDHAPVAARPLGRITRGWRRVMRRPARSLAVLATGAALLLGGVALPLWTSVRAHAAASERADRLAHLPADLCIEGDPEQRALVPLDERSRVVDELDKLLQLDQQDIGIRLLRAASWLDYGELQRARDDFAAIAASTDSAYVRELAKRYAAAAPGPNGSGRIDLTGLPEPQSDVDFFLAGFHALRARDCARADELLSRAEAYLPARDLRQLAILGKQPPEPQRAMAEANWLEGRYGHPTARTQHTIAVALLQQREYRAAIPYCEQALALRPDRHGPWNNLGLAHLRLGQLDDALRCLERAVALRPWLPNSASNLSQTLRQLGQHEQARLAAEQIADTGWREYELGNIDQDLALTALITHDDKAQRAAAERAAQHYLLAEGDKASINPRAKSVRAARLLAEALAHDDLDGALVPFLASMRSDPRNPRAIANLSQMLDKTTLTDDVRGRLRLWLCDLAVDLNPDDAALREQRTRLIQDLTSR